MVVKKKGMNAKKKVAIGVGLGVATAAAAAAGYYFFGAKNAASHRKKAAAWANKLKQDVVKQGKKLEKLDQKAIKMIVDQTTKAYQKIKSIDKKDLLAAATELEKNWREVKKEIEGTSKTVATTAKKMAKKAVSAKKKVAKK